MVKFTVHTPLYRLHIGIAHKRSLSANKKRGQSDAFLRLIDELTRVRVGSRISRIVRRVLHVKLLHRFVGINLIALAFTTNLAVPHAAAFSAHDTVYQPTTLIVDTPISTTVVRRYPVEGPVRINQGYGLFHPALDIGGNIGESIHPVMNGTVEQTGLHIMYGNFVIVSHPDGYESLYAHLNKIAVKTGDEVTTQSVLGELGNTGHSTGPHVHLEIRKNGQHISPFSVLPSLK